MGVEEEFLLVDTAGHLAANGPEVSDAVDDTVDEEAGQVDHELRRCQVESATPICTTADDVSTALCGLRDRLAAEAARHDLRLLPSGTAPLADDRPPRLTPDSRYHRLARQLGVLAPEMLVCGTHVHIGIPDESAGLMISNHVRPWLPVLLALTANSPFHDGVDTGYASWRHELGKRWPSAGAPPHIESVDDYEARLAGLRKAGAVLDRGMLYWDIRLSAHQPTVEVRIADVVPTVAEAVMLAVLVRAIANRALAGETDCSSSTLAPEVLRARLWRSARDGLAGHCVDPRTGRLEPGWHVVDGLVDTVRPWLRSTGDDDVIGPTLAWLREVGTGADRQRAAFGRRARLTDVTDGLAWRGTTVDDRSPADPPDTCPT